jgi:hypothetical protein
MPGRFELTVRSATAKLTGPRQQTLISIKTSQHVHGRVSHARGALSILAASVAPAADSGVKPPTIPE